MLGIDSFADYVEVQRYLEELTPVAALDMVLAEQDRLTFTLTLRDTKELFFQHLSLGRKLIKLAERASDLAFDDLLLTPISKFVWQSKD